MMLVFLLEEQSAKAMLEGLLPRLLPSNDMDFRYIVFEGKRDLKSQLNRKLRKWSGPDAIFVVLCDQDSSNCKDLKAELIKRCPEQKRDSVIVRIVCRELESWYFGDLTAVENALDVPNLVAHQKKKKYRVPDDIGAPATELQKITSNAYKKVAGSQAIGSRLSLTSNTSKSFQVFIKRIRRIVQTN